MTEGYTKEDIKLAIRTILPKLKREFNANEVSEMFSIPIENIHIYLDREIQNNNS